MMENDSEDAEISLIDLLLVVAENLKLLILGPMFAGIVALGVAYLYPQSYTSNAILSLPTPTASPTPTPAQAAAIMQSPVVLDPVVRSLEQSLDRTIEEQRLALASRIKITVGKDLLIRLEATGPTPAGAQALANAVIDSWLHTTLPGPKDRADLEKRLGYAKKSLESISRLIDQLGADGTSVLGKPLTRGDAGTSLVAVGELQSRYLADVLSIPRALQGLSRDVVVQLPTMPIKAVAPKKALIAVLAALAAGFVLLLFVFVRQAVRNAAAHPDTAKKYEALQSVLSGRFRSSS